MNFPKRKHFLIALAFILPLAAVWWLSAPSYHELYVSIPSFHSDIWNYTERTSLSYQDDPGVEYVLRREGTAYTEVVGWQKAGDGMAYLDRWLVEQGWERTDMYREGDPALPESQFLKFGETYAVYTDPDDRSGFGGSRRGVLGRVTVAVWPRCGATEPSACQISAFNVVVVTVKPSWWRVLSHALDD